MPWLSPLTLVASVVLFFSDHDLLMMYRNTHSRGRMGLGVAVMTSMVWSSILRISEALAP
ncbi:Uncharacterised protein [Bordetella pertussis]|nr:Uncharacterised protein [Bordetella pertussis]CFU81194.1 Uncharacterised protein [Bordetella pertussis]CFW35874.1 Uncharacterised protein [Bordetella pertussis]CPH86531.1 Uncharacterised protein [Bordetella pertussis]CPK98342.1 Uncharacterised protein [Bordetella pertussis]